MWVLYFCSNTAGNSIIQIKSVHKKNAWNVNLQETLDLDKILCHNIFEHLACKLSFLGSLWNIVHPFHIRYDYKKECGYMIYGSRKLSLPRIIVCNLHERSTNDNRANPRRFIQQKSCITNALPCFGGICQILHKYVLGSTWRGPTL